MSPAVVLVGMFLVLAFTGVPIAFCLAVASVVTTWYMGFPAVVVAQRIATGLQSFPLIAIPLFVLAGSIMAKGGVARRIVDFAYIIVGPFRGGLAMVNCIQSMLFGGVSGSAIADISSTGPIMIPMMKQKGYDNEFATALTVASATQGIIIPPSHNMIIYAMAAGGVSVGQLFLAGYIPGIMIGIGLMITSFIIAVKRGYPREKRPPLNDCVRISVDGILAVLAAVIIVGGIAFGIFTATEASAIAVVYATFLGLFVYKELKLRDLWPILVESVKTISTVLFLIASASAFAWLLTRLQVPTMIMRSMLSITSSPIILLLLINILLVILGMLMDVAPLIVITTPILLPVVTAAGMSPVTFGIVLLLNLGIGLTTPPVGTGLFVGCSVGHTTVEKTSRAMVAFWPAMIIVLLLTTFIPALTTFLPSLIVK
ncbi:TRAP transporter large permease [Marispirochaeta sp.]|uniref:TRAP transporter large permease n=1 Tax=Marispirochaeta sp. TaxID=2038653 RepID=UPI0029C7A352|nr:TRAP transporter large permease [Marispirochaeta sp.]